MKYRVYMQFVGSTSVEVEADSEEEAVERALDEAPQNDFGIADWDAGEWCVSDNVDDHSVRLIGE